jgi:5'-methylthioadenosine phosphorylase
MFRSWGGDTIGMTLVPECVLAREAEICYLPINLVTDYDVWSDKLLSVDEIVMTLKENVNKIRRILENIIPIIPDERNCLCENALKDALL